MLIAFLSINLLRLENDREGSRRKTVVFRCHVDANVGGRGYTTISERVNLVTSVICEVCRMRLDVSTDGGQLEPSPSARSMRMMLAPIPLVALAIILLEQTCF
jgi:hypothetical protein